MSVIGIDLGATKVAVAVFDTDGNFINKKSVLLGGRKGDEVGDLIVEIIKELAQRHEITGAGICIPGIVYSKKETVWAPNIPGWENFPLKKYILKALGYKSVEIFIESDRTCYILGERWRGAAKGCDNAIYLAVGSGIGGGILLDGRVIHGSNDIVGATGWMALESEYDKDWDACGCFETFASGNGIGYQARKLLENCTSEEYNSVESPIRNKAISDVIAQDVFAAYECGDPIAVKVIEKAVQMWGKGAANLVSLFDPEKVIFGGGVFSGPAALLIPKIYEEAEKWGQPISMKTVKFCPSELGSDAALLGSAYLSLGML